MKFEIGGYYLLGDRVFQIRSMEKTSYYCYVYNLSGRKTSEDYWSKNYVHGWASKRMKPKAWRNLHKTNGRQA